MRSDHVRKKAERTSCSVYTSYTIIKQRTKKVKPPLPKDRLCE
jgi:hypothetical protein